MAQVTRYGVLDMQVCCPSEWTDEQIVEFANSENPAGTQSGWCITKAGDSVLQGANERVSCIGGPDNSIHVMLHC
jgi:hypothetical protein